MGCGKVSSISRILPLHHPRGQLPKWINNYKIEDMANVKGTIMSEFGVKDQYEAKLIDGTVSSPYPNAQTINHFNLPVLEVSSFWEVILQHIENTVSQKGNSWDWLIEIGSKRTHLKYSEIEPKSLRIASGLYKLGLRPEDLVHIFVRDNSSHAFLLYLAIWRLRGIVCLVDPLNKGVDTKLGEHCQATAHFVVCDHYYEGYVIQLMTEYPQRRFILISSGKLRNSSSLEISDLLRDDGRGFPCNSLEYTQGGSDDVILITNNGSAHTNVSLIVTLNHLGLLRSFASHSRQYFYPITRSTDDVSHTSNVGNHVLTKFLLPLVSIFVGRTMILLETPIIQSVVLVIREFGLNSICGNPEYLHEISRHVAEQGGSIPTITSALLYSTVSTSFSEKLIRKGFPNLKVVDVIYGFEEGLFLTSTIPPPSANEFDVRLKSNLPSNLTGPLIHPHTIGTLGIFAIAKIIDLDTGVRLCPGEPGELCFKTATALKYYKFPESKHTKRIVDGWIHSGDFGYYDRSGNLYVTGKVDEVFKYYADYISPHELETAIQAHPDIGQCIVIGLPDPQAGHLPCAVIVRRPGSNVSSKEIRTFVNSRASNSKQLRGGIVFIDELPANRENAAFRQHLLEYIRRHPH